MVMKNCYDQQKENNADSTYYRLGEFMRDWIKRYDIFATILIFLLMIPAERAEWFSSLENQTLSIRHIFRMTHGDGANMAFPADQVGIVYLDEQFFDEYGSFPLRRTDVGIIVENLRILGAKVVMVDMLMDFPSSYNEDPIIAKSLTRAGNNILVSMLALREGKISKINYPTEVIKKATVTAYSNHTKSGNMLNRLRVYPEAAEKYNEWPASVLSVAMALGVEPKIKKGLLTIGPHQIRLDGFNDFINDYPLLPVGYPFLHRVPEVGVDGMTILELDREDEDEIAELKSRIEGKIILLGDTSEVSHDIFDTIIGEVYGVEIMADEVATILKNAPLAPVSTGGEVALALSFMILLISLHFISEPKLRYLAAGLLLAVYIFFAGRPMSILMWHFPWPIL